MTARVTQALLSYDRCAAPLEPRYGFVRGNDYTFSSTVSYGCVRGYRLVGPAERVCQADGAWSDNPPQCQSELIYVLILNIVVFRT